MLDDLKLIHSRDKQDALGVAAKSWQQYLHNFNFVSTNSKNFKNLVIAGMGGSGLAAKFFKNWASLDIPVEVVQDYNLPAYVNEDTLLVTVSYSGNTEENISIINQALGLKSKPTVIAITDGGKLLEIAKQNKLAFIQLPVGYQPRMTFGYQLRALAEISQQLGLRNNLIEQLEGAAKKLSLKLTNWQEVRATKDNAAKKLSLELVGKSVVVYSSAINFPAAYKWKINFNENAKNIAWANQFPEFDHNEFLGWTSHPIDKPYSVIELRSSFDNSQIIKRFEITEKLLSGQKPAAEIINLEGDTWLDQMLFAVALGDFVSIYLAILNNVDPTPVDIIETLKKELN
ncbi:MAG TPA: bifunctional phosphoglucose/phosphomannose isomerase [Candidatus Saccharimonadia bacterium]|nr:bifunctional phosphoglucose/phosphomannose isomerase [Candidatus Saccharimonadia bacterium]